jgi:hypothetical protein
MHQTHHHLRTGGILAAAVLAAVFATTRTPAQSLPPMQPTTTQPIPTQPTTLTPQTLTPQTLTPQAPGAPVASAPPANPAHHAEITFAGGQLEVRADNSSLNQILRSISRRAGLKITGGVEDQRVFGNYGPGSISSVLATLLDGTETNMLLLAGDAQNPPELQLTPRNGGVSPPGPNSEAYAMYDDSIDQQAPIPPPTPRSPNASSQPETHGLAGSPTVPQPLNESSVSPSHPAPAAAILPMPSTNSAPTPAAASATPRHLTPEIVMQELLMMQEQKKLQEQQRDAQAREEQARQQKKLKTQQPSSQTPASSTPPQ